MAVNWAWRAEHAAHHVRLTTLERLTATVGSSVGALSDPGRPDLVAAVMELTEAGQLRSLLTSVRASDEGRRVLREKPRIDGAFLQRARGCEPGTLGQAYAEFMDARGFNPGGRPPVRFVEDPDEAYIAARAREAHDLFHALTGCPTSVEGELGLKAFEFANMGLPVGLLSLAAASRLTRSRRRKFLNELLPWGVKAGSSCELLLNAHFESRLEQNLPDFRAEFRLSAPPSPASH